MYSRSPNRDELEVGKKVETDDCCIRNQVVGGRLGGSCGTLGPSRRCRRRPAFRCPHITLRGNGECGTAPK